MVLDVDRSAFHGVVGGRFRIEREVGRGGVGIVFRAFAEITSCAFGGSSLDRLFITSARIGLDEVALGSQPYAGGLFMTIPGVSGVAEQPFAG